MKTLRSPLSAFLVAVLLLALFQPVVAAVERQIPETSLAAIPECLSLDILEYNGNIVRLQNEEPDLNSIVYLNHDGTKSLYYFQEAIKYVDSSGHVKDKSDKLYPTPSSISRAGYAYQNTYNDIVTQFPESFTPERGVRVTKDDNIIEMIPKVEENMSPAAASNVTLLDDTTVIYSNVFGQDTAVNYSPTFTGVKEEIVLYQPIDNYSFSFVLDTGNYTAVKEGTQISLYDGTEKAGLISEIVVYDSSNAPNITFDNEIQLIPTEDNGKYIYTIHIDEEFAKSEDTVYPIHIDPTITINASGSGTNKTIVDAPVYSGLPSTNHGSNIYNRIGYVGTSGNLDYGVGRTLMKFPGLMSNEIFLSLADSEISNVSLVLAEVSGKSGAATIRAHYYTGPAWTENGVTYNNCSWNGLGSAISSVSISGSSTAFRTFNITAAAKLWRTDPAKANKGIILKNITSETNSSYEKAFSSAEASINKPYVSVTYAKRSFNPLTVINRYDKGYSVYYGETEATSRSKISSYTSSVGSRYSSLLGLTLSSATPAYYKSTCDNCKGTVTSSNLDTLCSHSANHTLVNTIHNDFASNISVGARATSILWSAHKISANYGAGLNYNRSVTFNKKYIYSINKYSSSARDNSSKCLIMHELNHTIGAPDHYHEILSNGTCRSGAICSVCGTNPRPSSCIMKSTGVSINSNDVICPHCIRDIRTYLISNGFAK